MPRNVKYILLNNFRNKESDNEMYLVSWSNIAKYFVQKSYNKFGIDLQKIWHIN